MDRVAELAIADTTAPAGSGRVREAPPVSPVEAMTGSVALAEVRDLQRQRGLRALGSARRRGRARGGPDVTRGGPDVTRGWDATCRPTPGRMSLCR